MSDKLWEFVNDRSCIRPSGDVAWNGMGMLKDGERRFNEEQDAELGQHFCGACPVIKTSGGVSAATASSWPAPLLAFTAGSPLESCM